MGYFKTFLFIVGSLVLSWSFVNFHNELSKEDHFAPQFDAAFFSVQKTDGHRQVITASHNCTKDLLAGQSIQEAIDQVSENAVICLGAGNFKGNIKITKSVTLRGVNREQTIIKAEEPHLTFIHIENSKEIQVFLENFTLDGNQPRGASLTGVNVLGKAVVTLTNIDLTRRGDAMNISGESQLTLTNSRVFDNSDGVFVNRSARLIIRYSQIFDNGHYQSPGFGVFASDSAQLTLENTKIHGNNGGGILAFTLEQVSIFSSEIFNNGSGIFISSSKLNMNDSWISDNSDCGINVQSREKKVDLNGKGNWIKNNARDVCTTMSLPENFLRLEPPQQLLDKVEVCSHGCEFTDIVTAVRMVKAEGRVIIRGGNYPMVGVLVIAKNLSIEGMGEKQTRILGTTEGILIVGRAKTMIRNLSVVGSGGSGIHIINEASAAVEDTTIQENVGAGIFIWHQGSLSLKNSAILSNGNAGIDVRPEDGTSHVSVRNTRILGNRGGGIALYGNFQADVRDTQVSDNAGCGIKGGPVQGENNWVQVNAQDFCEFMPQENFLRTVPFQPLHNEVTVCANSCDFSRVPEAVWAVRPRGVVHVQEGTYTDVVTVTKDLYLQGEGREKVVFDGRDLTVPLSGILIHGSAQATVKDLSVKNFKNNGILVRESAQVLIMNVDLISNSTGFRAAFGSPKNVELRNVKIQENNTGIAAGSFVRDTNELLITDSMIFDNRVYGLVIEGATQMKILNSSIIANGQYGLYGINSSSTTLQSSKVVGNGTMPNCKKVEIQCNGIILSERSQATIRDSIIEANTDWGVGVDLKNCNERSYFFEGKVTFEGSNTVAGNNKSGNNDNKGNPGNHPFKNLPDGQICVP